MSVTNCLNVEFTVLRDKTLCRIVRALTNQLFCSQTCLTGKRPRHASIHVSNFALCMSRNEVNHFRCQLIGGQIFDDWFICSGQSDTDYHGSNGQADTHSLHSSHLSVQDDPLLIRTHKQQTSQQVSRKHLFHSNNNIFSI